MGSFDSWQEAAALDQRLRELEAEIQALKDKGVPIATPGLQPPSLTNTSNTPLPASIPPQVSGLTVTPKIQKVILNWNAANISDLLRYEIQVAPNPNFDSITTLYTNNTTFTIDDVTTDENISVRVRATNTSGGNGPFSAIISSNPLLVDTANIARQATTTQRLSFVSGTTAIGTNVWTTLDDIDEVVVEEGAAVKIFYSFTVKTSASEGSPDDLDMRFRRGSTVLQTWTDPFHLVGTNTYRLFTAVFVDTDVTPGTYTYDVQFKQHVLGNGLSVAIRTLVIDEVLR